jgi:hypothetical protein
LPYPKRHRSSEKYFFYVQQRLKFYL